MTTIVPRLVELARGRLNYVVQALGFNVQHMSLEQLQELIGALRRDLRRYDDEIPDWARGALYTVNVQLGADTLELYTGNGEDQMTLEASLTALHELETKTEN